MRHTPLVLLPLLLLPHLLRADDAPTLAQLQQENRQLKAEVASLKNQLATLSGPPATQPSTPQSSLAPKTIGQLTWDNTDLAVTTAPDAAQADYQFKFTNRGPTPISITKISVSPNGTVTPDKPTYQPGESGILTGFTMLGHSGATTAYLFIDTDKLTQPPTTLTIHITLPELLQLTPPTLTWKVGEDPTPKTLSVKIGANVPFKMTSVLSSDPRFTVDATVLQEGQLYQIKVTPLSTTQSLSATIDLGEQLRHGGLAKTCQIPVAIK